MPDRNRVVVLVLPGVFFGLEGHRVADRSWMAENRYRAVLEVADGSPVTEVAQRYGVSRQTVYAWQKRYQERGADGLQEASRRPRSSPSRLAPDIEVICELRHSDSHRPRTRCAMS
jgi:transposase